MIGKSAFSNDDVAIGKITKIIDQRDTDQDDPNILCDIEKDLFQIVVNLNPSIFPSIDEETAILFSSQTLDSVVTEGIKLKVTKEELDKLIKGSS
jgi:hypothetical protein